MVVCTVIFENLRSIRRFRDGSALLTSNCSITDPNLLLPVCDHAATIGSAQQSNIPATKPLVPSGASDCLCAVLNKLQSSGEHCGISAARQAFFAKKQNGRVFLAAILRLRLRRAEKDPG
jgi:hypothetical protein